MAANPSVPPRLFACTAAAVVGKSDDAVSPARYALPDASTATAVPLSALDPPSNVEYTSAVPNGFNLSAKASLPPASTVRKAPAVVGKSIDAVEPAT